MGDRYTEACGVEACSRAMDTYAASGAHYRKWFPHS